jgi:hypothetical protein
MSIKRTELEILDMAISISRQHQSKINELGRIESKNIALEEPAEPKLKKGDTEGLRNYYEAKIHSTEVNCGFEWERKKKIGELNEEIIGLCNQLELLRWLYKDNIQEVE